MAKPIYVARGISDNVVTSYLVKDRSTGGTLARIKVTPDLDAPTVRDLAFALRNGILGAVAPVAATPSDPFDF